MTAFERRSLSVGETLGEKLRRLREEEQLTLEEAAHRLRITPRYLKALEAGRYQEMPGEVYTRSFLRSYAALLNIHPARVLELYEKERQVAVHFPGPHRILPPRAKSLRAVVTTNVLTRISIVLVIAAILGYLAWEVYHIIAPPALEVVDPAPDAVTASRIIAVSGRTEPEATVTINGTPVFVDQEGYFEEVLSLSPGAHTLEVVARRKRSRTAIERRTVLIEGEASAGDR